MSRENRKSGHLDHKIMKTVVWAVKAMKLIILATYSGRRSFESGKPWKWSFEPRNQEERHLSRESHEAIRLNHKIRKTVI